MESRVRYGMSTKKLKTHESQQEVELSAEEKERLKLIEEKEAFSGVRGIKMVSQGFLASLE